MEACKHAYIVPVFKKDDNEDICSYKAISLISLISKIAERVVLDRFSTRSVGLDTVHLLVRKIDHGEQTDVAFLDFSKAFDSVSHAHLISKLDQSGINGGNIITLVPIRKSSWLQRVVIYGESSDWLPVILGVSQGPLLGLALFVLFINDMPGVLSHSSTLAFFADEAKCFRAIFSDKDEKS